MCKKQKLKIKFSNPKKWWTDTILTVHYFCELLLHHKVSQHYKNIICIKLKTAMWQIHCQLFHTSSISKKCNIAQNAIIIHSCNQPLVSKHWRISVSDWGQHAGIMSREHRCGSTFTDQMPFVSHNKQCQITKWITEKFYILTRYMFKRTQRLSNASLMPGFHPSVAVAVLPLPFRRSVVPFCRSVVPLP